MDGKPGAAGWELTNKRQPRADPPFDFSISPLSLFFTRGWSVSGSVHSDREKPSGRFSIRGKTWEASPFNGRPHLAKLRARLPFLESCRKLQLRQRLALGDSAVPHLGSAEAQPFLCPRRLAPLSLSSSPCLLVFRVPWRSFQSVHNNRARGRLPPGDTEARDWLGCAVLSCSASPSGA